MEWRIGVDGDGELDNTGARAIVLRVHAAGGNGYIPLAQLSVVSTPSEVQKATAALGTNIAGQCELQGQAGKVTRTRNRTKQPRAKGGDAKPTDDDHKSWGTHVVQTGILTTLDMACPRHQPPPATIKPAQATPRKLATTPLSAAERLARATPLGVLSPAMRDVATRHPLDAVSRNVIGGRIAARDLATASTQRKLRALLVEHMPMCALSGDFTVSQMRKVLKVTEGGGSTATSILKAHFEDRVVEAGFRREPYDNAATYTNIVEAFASAEGCLSKTSVGMRQRELKTLVTSIVDHLIGPSWLLDDNLDPFSPSAAAARGWLHRSDGDHWGKVDTLIPNVVLDDAQVVVSAPIQYTTQRVAVVYTVTARVLEAFRGHDPGATPDSRGREPARLSEFTDRGVLECYLYSVVRCDIVLYAAGAAGATDLFHTLSVDADDTRAKSMLHYARFALAIVRVRHDVIQEDTGSGGMASRFSALPRPPTKANSGVDSARRQVPPTRNSRGAPSLTGCNCRVALDVGLVYDACLEPARTVDGAKSGSGATVFPAGGGNGSTIVVSAFAGRGSGRGSTVVDVLSTGLLAGAPPSGLEASAVRRAVVAGVEAVQREQAALWDEYNVIDDQNVTPTKAKVVPPDPVCASISITSAQSVVHAEQCWTVHVRIRRQAHVRVKESVGDHIGHGPLSLKGTRSHRHVPRDVEHKLMEEIRFHGRAVASVVLELFKEGYTVSAQDIRNKVARIVSQTHATYREYEQTHAAAAGSEGGDSGMTALLRRHINDSSHAVVVLYQHTSQIGRVSGTISPHVLLKLPATKVVGAGAAEGVESALFTLTQAQAQQLVHVSPPSEASGAARGEEQLRWSVFDTVVLGQPVPSATTARKAALDTVLSDNITVLGYFSTDISTMEAFSRCPEAISVDAMALTNRANMKFAQPVSLNAQGKNQIAGTSYVDKENALCLVWLLCVALPLVYGRQLDRTRLLISDGAPGWILAINTAIGRCLYGGGSAVRARCYWHMVVLTWLKMALQFSADASPFCLRCLRLVRKVYLLAETSTAVQWGLDHLRVLIYRAAQDGTISGHEQNALSRWLIPIEGSDRQALFLGERAAQSSGTLCRGTTGASESTHAVVRGKHGSGSLPGAHQLDDLDTSMSKVEGWATLGRATSESEQGRTMRKVSRYPGIDEEFSVLYTSHACSLLAQALQRCVHYTITCVAEDTFVATYTGAPPGGLDDDWDQMYTQKILTVRTRVLLSGTKVTEICCNGAKCNQMLTVCTHIAAYNKGAHGEGDAGARYLRTVFAGQVDSTYFLVQGDAVPRCKQWYPVRVDYKNMYPRTHGEASAVPAIERAATVTVSPPTNTQSGRAVVLARTGAEDIGERDTLMSDIRVLFNQGSQVRLLLRRAVDNVQQEAGRQGLLDDGSRAPKGSPPKTRHLFSHEHGGNAHTPRTHASGQDLCGGLGGGKAVVIDSDTTEHEENEKQDKGEGGRARLELMTRTNLQNECKAKGVRANQTSSAMVDELMCLWRKDQECGAAASRAATEGTTPTTRFYRLPDKDYRAASLLSTLRVPRSSQGIASRTQASGSSIHHLWTSPLLSSDSRDTINQEIFEDLETETNIPAVRPIADFTYRPRAHQLLIELCELLAERTMLDVLPSTLFVRRNPGRDEGVPPHVDFDYISKEVLPSDICTICGSSINRGEGRGQGARGLCKTQASPSCMRPPEDPHLFTLVVNCGPGDECEAFLNVCPAPVKVTINELRNDTFGNGYSILAVTKQRCTVPLAIPVGGLAGFSAWILHKTAGSAEEDVVTEESLAQRWSIDVRAVRPGTAVDRLKCRWRQTCPMIIGPRDAMLRRLVMSESEDDGEAMGERARAHLSIGDSAVNAAPPSGLNTNSSGVPGISLLELCTNDVHTVHMSFLPIRSLCALECTCKLWPIEDAARLQLATISPNGVPAMRFDSNWKYAAFHANARFFRLTAPELARVGDLLDADKDRVVPYEVLVTAHEKLCFNHSMCRRDMMSLADGVWLNDEVIK
jgi:hypothetical protein